MGTVFAVLGVGGAVAALVFGRMNSEGRERRMLVLPMFASGAALLLLLPAQLAPMVAAMTLVGLLNGPMDIGLFTLRQRRTDPAWMGRAFAVSMNFNFAGFPIGSAIAGWLAARSIEGAVAFGVVACLLAGAIAALGIPDADGRDASAPAITASRAPGK